MMLFYLLVGLYIILDSKGGDFGESFSGVYDKFLSSLNQLALRVSYNLFLLFLLIDFYKDFNYPKFIDF